MSFWRSWSARALAHLALPVPRRARVAHVYLEPKGALPRAGAECLCHLAALRYFRVASEHVCTQIIIYDGAHTHPFDTMALLRSHVRALGWWPRPLRVAGMTPRLLATRGVQRLGDEVTEHPTTMVAVTTAVSGVSAGGTEIPHGE